MIFWFLTSSRSSSGCILCLDCGARGAHDLHRGVQSPHHWFSNLRIQLEHPCCSVCLLKRQVGWGQGEGSGILNLLEVLCVLPQVTTVCYSSEKTLRSLLYLQKGMFSSAPVQTIYQLCVIKYKSTDPRPLVQDIKNHAQSCKHKYLWIIFYWSMFKRFAYRLNPKYTKCQSVYILMPLCCCCEWIAFGAGAFSSLPF